MDAHPVARSENVARVPKTNSCAVHVCCIPREQCLLIVCPPITPLEAGDAIYTREGARVLCESFHV